MAYGLFVLIDGYVNLVLADKTIQKSHYYSHKNQSVPPVHLVSYADGHPVFFKNQNAQAMSAINNGVDTLCMYKRRDMDADFLEKNKSYLEDPRGAGLWIWKAYFLLKTMKSAPENSVLIYADSPVVFKKPITPLLEDMQKTDVLLLSDGTPRKHITHMHEIVSKDMIESYVDDAESFLKTPNVWACFLMVKNNERARAFVEKWLWTMTHGSKNIPGHDQTFLAITAFQNPEGVKSMDMDVFHQFFKNVHRHPKDESQSLIPDMNSTSVKWFKISEWGYNSRWMRKLRAMFQS